MTYSRGDDGGQCSVARRKPESGSIETSSGSSSSGNLRPAGWRCGTRGVSPTVVVVDVSEGPAHRGDIAGGEVSTETLVTTGGSSFLQPGEPSVLEARVDPTPGAPRRTAAQMAEATRVLVEFGLHSCNPYLALSAPPCRAMRPNGPGRRRPGAPLGPRRPDPLRRFGPTDRGSSGGIRPPWTGRRQNMVLSLADVSGITWSTSPVLDELAVAVEAKMSDARVVGSPGQWLEQCRRRIVLGDRPFDSTRSCPMVGSHALEVVDERLLAVADPDCAGDTRYPRKRDRLCRPAFVEHEGVEGFERCACSAQFASSVRRSGDPAAWSRAETRRFDGPTSRRPGR